MKVNGKLRCSVTGISFEEPDQIVARRRERINNALTNTVTVGQQVKWSELDICM
jgi:hypothetical protein